MQMYISRSIIFASTFAESLACNELPVTGKHKAEYCSGALQLNLRSANACTPFLLRTNLGQRDSSCNSVKRRSMIKSCTTHRCRASSAVVSQSPFSYCDVSAAKVASSTTLADVHSQICVFRLMRPFEARPFRAPWRWHTRCLQTLRLGVRGRPRLACSSAPVLVAPSNIAFMYERSDLKRASSIVRDAQAWHTFQRDGLRPKSA